MQSRNVSRARKRTYSLSVLFASIVLLFYFYTTRQQITLGPAVSLPGTYQYFHETDFHRTTKLFGAVSHCDARFARANSPEIDEVRASLRALLKTYIVTMEDLKIETWLAHGALLGWYWNRRLLPWDTDLDVQVSAEGIALLARSHNMTEYRYTVSDGEAPRTYLLDINPHHVITSGADVANKIDARWIDTTDGKFIDITAVHRVDVDGVAGGVKMSSSEKKKLFCKDGHQYKVNTPCDVQTHILF